MILLRTLTNSFFFNQQLKSSQPEWLYLLENNARVKTDERWLSIQSLKMSSGPVDIIREYHITFKGHPSNHRKQWELLDHFNWNVAELINYLDQQYTVSLRYHQVQKPETDAIDLFSITNYKLGRLLSHLFVKVQHVPTTQVFNPFVVFCAGTGSIGLKNKTTARNQVLQALADGRLAALPNTVSNALHILDRIRVDELPYPLERLELLPQLIENDAWHVTRLPGGLLQLVVEEANSASIFLQTVSTSRLKKAALKAGQTVMRVAA